MVSYSLRFGAYGFRGGGDIWSITDLKFDITNVMLGREQSVPFTCRQIPYSEWFVLGSVYPHV